MPTPTALRSGLTGLSTLAASDLEALWRQVEAPEQAEAALRDTLPLMINGYGAAAATLAADWYDETRDEVEARGRFRAIPAAVPEVGAQALVGWAIETSQDFDGFRGLIAGGMQRRIANFSRLTVAGSSVADPAARGWERTGLGECEFCSMLINRGAVYSEASADFQAHDNCHCVAVPAWR